MTVSVYFAAGRRLWPEYEAHLPEALREAGIDAEIRLNAPNPAAVDYIVFAPSGDITDFTPFVNCKAVLNLWAGVERIVGNKTLTQPLARMVDPGLTEGMVEYVVGHVLRHHLGMDAHILGQDGIWRNHILPPIARERPVAVLGLGELGRAAATALAALNFPVMGWSRSEKKVAGVDCHSGEAGLAHVLSRAEIIVLLLPLTPDTTSLINAERLALMPEGAFIVNPGRGALIDDAALLAALDAGRIGHATLDVFRTEPLPPDHPYWAHPRVTVTPHIAADTRAVTAARVIAENILRGEAGEPFLYLVDRARGY
ncbi:2-hydroxyacid dehydrogenase [Defluviimonas sp. SAOS-178_SWC]|uniref:2-hydroxyacid dehydrogenase n=1 Tax=Defluviimonas sp. SAOS-178_SWC TaxID=3121287 RepID=UPI003221D836